MQMVKVIKNETDYAAAMDRLSVLMDADVPAGSAQENELELLALLVESWERSVVPPVRPDPVEAILFRMDQQGLTRKDLVPYIGSAARVSEVLARKRPLSLAMIRRLHQGLGIPADVLIQDGSSGAAALKEESNLDYSRFPLKEMAERGCFGKLSMRLPDIKDYAEELVSRLIGELSVDDRSPVLFRAPLHQRGEKKIDDYALLAWRLCVIKKARKLELGKAYKKGTVTQKWMREVARLSTFKDGPRLAGEFLARHGIALVIEPHYLKTYLDGAALLDGNTPIVALTLRHDRLDNFWFALMHELAHVAKHLTPEHPVFLDDLDGEGQDRLEDEADRMATDALIPEEAWERSPVRVTHDSTDAVALADKLGIHPAIVAGRLRHETRNFQLLARVISKAEKPSSLIATA